MLVIKKYEKLWKDNPVKILDIIIEKIEDNEDTYPNYIKSFFEDISTKIEDDEDYDYINTFKSFNGKLNKKLEKYLNKYLDL
jgi:hypothetical protein